MIPRSFFTDQDVVHIAQQLLGCRIETNFEGAYTSGIICETEAYRAPEDKASHAYNHRRTARTEIFYGKGGYSYIYLCYGIHHLFNIITGPIDTPHAVLVRAVIPVQGIDIMMERRNTENQNILTNGPGKWTSAFGITTTWSGIDLLDNRSPIKIFPPTSAFSEVEIMATPRIGIDYAEEWVDVEWRFLIR